MQIDTALSPQQVAYQKTFGFLRFPGLFANDLESIVEAFEEVWERDGDGAVSIEDPVHKNRPRKMLPDFVNRHPVLRSITTDPRIDAIAESLLGEGYEFAGSDGNLAWCDTEWHIDSYGAIPGLSYLKISLYLDPLGPETGAIRLMPGTHRTSPEHFGDYFTNLQLNTPRDALGTSGEDLPCYLLESEPGDLLLWDYRLFHASYGGRERRRFLSINFHERSSEVEQAEH